MRNLNQAVRDDTGLGPWVAKLDDAKRALFDTPSRGSQYSGTSIMWRNVGAFIAGFATWAVVGWLSFVLLRALWPEYVIAEPAWAFTLPMQLARLLVGVVSSIASGCVVALVSGRRRSLTPWILGTVLFLIFTPFHIQLWDKFPVWYHLFFLLTLIPILGLSARALTLPSNHLAA